MNITQAIIDRLTENKSSIKTYADFDRATKTGEELGAEFDKWNNTNVGMDFIVVYVPTVQRYTVVFNMTNWAARSKTGTYLGWFANKGFFSI